MEKLKNNIGGNNSEKNMSRRDFLKKTSIAAAGYSLRSIADHFTGKEMTVKEVDEAIDSIPIPFDAQELPTPLDTLEDTLQACEDKGFPTEKSEIFTQLSEADDILKKINQINANIQGSLDMISAEKLRELYDSLYVWKVRKLELSYMNTLTDLSKEYEEIKKDAGSILEEIKKLENEHNGNDKSKSKENRRYMA